MYRQFLAMAIGQYEVTKMAQEKWKDRIIKEWEESKKLPRKKKKQKRKELLLDWTFASYDPFNILK